MSTALAEPPSARVRQRVRQRLEAIRQAKRLWRHDRTAFARDRLKILPKDEGLIAFERNSVQRKLDADLDNLLHEHGRVRAIILKARQMGISTDVGARFYHGACYDEGSRTLIMTHRDDSTRALHAMVERYHENDPERPALRDGLRKQLAFDNDSSFTVQTAGAVSTGAGRGFTFRRAHLSELAFWQNPQDHLNAVLNAVSKGPGSEVIIESTANGTGGPFYEMAMAARQGKNEYTLLFYPWFDHDEYAADPPAGWSPPESVLEMAEMHALSPRQLYWAARENASLAAIDGTEDPNTELCWRFKQEYPSTIDEAFRAARAGGYIAASVVAKARKRINAYQPDMPLIFGCDFATGGGAGDEEHLSAKRLSGRQADPEGSEDGDSNVFLDRRGRTMGRNLYDRFKDRNTLSVANRLQAAIDRLNPARVFMDRGGGGAAVYDILVTRGYGGVLELVDFGAAAKPVDDRKYRNKRSEMTGDLREWLQDGDIPDDDLLETEMTSEWVVSDDERGLTLASKRDVRRKLKISPDGADAAKCTFAAAVRAPTPGGIVVGGAG